MPQHHKTGLHTQSHNTFTVLDIVS